jgi:hypothetical protein
MQVAAITVPAKHDPFESVRSLVGKCFMHPLVDYLFVGGAITIPVFIALYFLPGITPARASITLRAFIFLNGAHFAASTVRLYTKPGAKRDFPFLSWGFPAVCLAAVWAGLYWPGLGKNLTALYLTWSPYHYAAQTYGLAVMYAMRSGARLDRHDKTQMWWVCLLPFLYALMTAREGGLAWFVSREWLATVPVLWMIYRALVSVVTAGIFLLPVSLFWQLHRMRGRNVPAISLLLQITNGIWWLGTDYLNGWWWTAMFHSIQYLIIVVVRHVDEQMKRPDANPKLHRPFVYGGIFYGVSFVLGIFLFFVVPLAYVPLGFNATRSLAMMVVIINLHHFIVDGYIWKTKPAGGKPLPGLRLDPAPAIG